jgi:lysophospholipase L1-like esterase
MRKKLALSAVSILVTLLVAEAALRLLGVGSTGRGSSWFAGGNHPRFLFQADPASGYTLRPGFRGEEVSRGREFDVPVAIDPQGLRVQPHPAPPHPRVLAVGDSITFGEGVPADGTYAAVLETTLGVRVDNAGVPGYSSAQMLGRLRRYLPVLRPDVVLMTLSPLWDRQRCAAPFVYRDGYIVGQGYADRLVLLDGNLYLRETRLPLLGTATAYAERYSAVMRLALPALAGAGHRLLHRSREEVPAPADYEPTVRNLQEARQLAARSGARFLVVLIDDRGKDFQRDRQALEARLRQLGIPWVAADDLLPGARWERLRYPIDTHWNAAGHAAVGQALAPRIKPLLGGAAPPGG